MRLRTTLKSSLCSPQIAASFLTAAITLSARSARAAVSIYGGPTYDPASNTGFSSPNVNGAGDGVGVGSATKYSGGTSLGFRAFRWDTSGGANVELGNLGTNSSGFTASQASGINSTGTAVGYASKYSTNIDLGHRAVRWDANANAAIELNSLGAKSNGNAVSGASGINAAGTVVGFSLKYSGDTSLGSRAVRWNAGGTAATELGTLGTNSAGFGGSSANAVNAAGAAVGYADKYNGESYVGSLAVRWNAGVTVATELGTIGTSNSSTNDVAYAIDTAGNAVGQADKYSGSNYLGYRAVRWSASGTAATELGTLGTDSNGVTYSNAFTVNPAGTAVGFANKYSGGTFVGQRAIRWEAGSTTPTELGTLGTFNSGTGSAEAYAINAIGISVGEAAKVSADTYLGERAVAWGADGLALDLNTLLSPADVALWTLTQAYSISDTNWITGIGTFDPDGVGPAASYQRAFLIQLPEPASITFVAASLALTMCKRRRTVGKQAF